MNNSLGTRAIDHTLIDEYRSMADDEFVTSLIEQYLAESALQVEAITTAIARGELQSVRAVAHALKGASSTIGAAAFSAMCGEIEGHTRAGTVDAIPGLGAALAAEYQCVRQELATLSSPALGVTHPAR